MRNVGEFASQSLLGEMIIQSTSNGGAECRFEVMEQCEVPPLFGALNLECDSGCAGADSAGT